MSGSKGGPPGFLPTLSSGIPALVRVSSISLAGPDRQTLGLVSGPGRNASVTNIQIGRKIDEVIPVCYEGYGSIFLGSKLRYNAKFDVQQAC